MTTIARAIANFYRDEFGLHEKPSRDPRRLTAAIRVFCRRVVLSADGALRRARRVTYEHVFWALIVALLILFVVALIVGETGVARGGR